MPKVSVVIPSYNHARYLDRRVQSILHQSFRDFEVIFLDDASTDDTKAVMEKYVSSPNMKCIFNEVNSGSTFKQWNKGIKEAQGDFVWIAESDDYADERFLSRLVTVMEENPNVGICYCQSWIVDECDTVLCMAADWRKYPRERRYSQNFVNNGLAELSQFWVQKCVIPNVSATLMRRSVLEQIKGADESLKLCGDWMTYLRILKVSDIAFLAEPMNYFRTHGNTVRHKTKNRGLYSEEAYQVLLDCVRSSNVSESTLLEARQSAMHYWMADVFAPPVTVSLKRNKKIFYLARQADPEYCTRLPKMIARHLIHSSNVFAPVRHLWRTVRGGNDTGNLGQNEY